MSRRSAKFLSGPLSVHVFAMTGAASIGMFATALGEMAELYFIALLKDAALLAAMGFGATLLFFPFALALGLTATMAALVAQPLGRGEAGEARQMATHISLFGAVVSTAVALLMAIFCPLLLQSLGASPEVTKLATDYVRGMLIAIPFMTLGMMWSGLLRAHGDARGAMYVAIAAALINMVLALVLILSLSLALKGAVLAAIAGKLTLAIASFVRVQGHYRGLGPVMKGSQVFGDGPIRHMALPAMAYNLATPIGHVWVTSGVAAYGEDAVAGYAVIARLTPLIFCGIFALSAALTPIIGQNFGAGAFHRVRRTVSAATTMVLLYVGCIWIGLVLLEQPLSDHLGLAGAGQSIVFWFAVAVVPLFSFHGALLISTAVLNNLGRPVWAMGLNWVRNTLGVLPFVWAGAALAGASGVVVGRALGGLVFGLIGLWLAHGLIRHVEARQLTKG